MDSVKDTYQLANDDFTNEANEAPSAMDIDNHVGELLIKHGVLKPQDMPRIVAIQRQNNMLFGEAAISLGLMTEADLQQALTQQFNYSYLQQDKRLLDKQLVAAHASSSAEVESIRSLRGQLLMRWFDHGNKTLAVTSASEDDKANLLTANLAITFSQLNKKTLLIDANLRQSSQQRLFNIDTKVGLANILANRQGKYMLNRQQSFPNLAILTAGSEVPNPQELLSQPVFADLLVDLENIYDIILIDTPPLNLGADVLTIAAKSKAAMIVATKNVTSALAFQQLGTQLAMTGAKLVGSVFQEF